MAIWFLRIEANPLNNRLTPAITQYVEKCNWLKQHLIVNMAYTGLVLMSAILLVVIRFSLKYLISER